MDESILGRDGKQSPEYVQADRHSRCGGGRTRNEATFISPSTQRKQVIQRCK